MVRHLDTMSSGAFAPLAPRVQHSHTPGTWPTGYLLPHVSLTLVILLAKVHCARIVVVVPGIRVVHVEPNALDLLKNIREGELRRELRVLVVRNYLRPSCVHKR